MYHLMGKSSLFWGPKSINQGCKGSQDYCRATPKIGWLASGCVSPKYIYIWQIYANIWYLRLSYFWGRMMISQWIFGYTIFRLIQKYGTSWYICNFYGWCLGQMEQDAARKSGHLAFVKVQQRSRSKLAGYIMICLEYIATMILRFVACIYLTIYLSI